MKIIAVFRKSFIEQLRDYWVLIMTLIVSPFFVVIYWLMVGGGSTSYNVMVINNDKGVPAQNIYLGKEIISMLSDIKYKNGNPVLNILQISDRSKAELKLQNRDAAALFIIPEDFSEKLGVADSIAKPGSYITIVGDISNTQYTIAGIMASAGFEEFCKAALGYTNPIEVREELLGRGLTKTEFENYVPGLIIFSVIMLIYTVAMSIIREIENGTIRRLKISGLTSFQYLTGLSMTQVIVAVISVLLTVFTAVSLGFRFEGSFLIFLLIMLLMIINIIGIGLMVVAFSRSAIFVLSAGTFPLFILMFFTGALYPMPRNELFEVAGHMVAWNDFLPPTSAVIALNKVMSLNASFTDVKFEITLLSVLSVLYFAAGVWLFRRLHFKRV
ncbi:MAG: ABC transporter permease [Bacteroidota bacterium]